MMRRSPTKIVHAKQTCPIAFVADLVGDVWKILIVRDLASGAKRFGELSTSLEGASTRTLTLKLKQLEEHGLVVRTAYQERPPRVEYDLTPKGRDLIEIIDAMRTYGKRHLV